LEIAVSCLEWLRAHHETQFSRFLSLFKKGGFEFINSTYTQPYCLTISEESNLKQFELGIETLNQLGLESNIYYASESSVHPQLPQILSKFGIEFASLRTRLLGVNPSTPYGNIDWIGLDGTKIQSIINQSGVFNGEYWHGAFFQELPQLLYQALSFWHVNYIVYSCLEDFIMEIFIMEILIIQN
jgi:alpha-mannosidase